MSGSWGYYIQGNLKEKEIDELGSRLSVIIHCPVHYPAYDKRMFECKCGVVFPLYLLEGGHFTVEQIKEKHEREKRMIRG